MKDTFDKVVMDETRQEEIRAGLMVKKRAKKTWIAPVAAVAAAIAVIMLVPGTRSAVVKAAETLYATFTSKFNNLTVSVDETSFSENGVQVHKISAQYDFSNYEPWAQVKDGRLYFVLNGKWTDITDKCSAKEAFYFEQTEKNGYKTILFVGGTPDDYGWGQIIRNPNGEMVEGMAFIDDINSEPEWLKSIKNQEQTRDFMITTFSKDDISVLVGKTVSTVSKPAEN